MMQSSKHRLSRSLIVAAMLIVAALHASSAAMPETDANVREMVAGGLRALAEGKPEAAVEKLRAAHEAEPDNAIITFDLGTAELASGALEDAERTLALAATQVAPDLALAVARNRALTAARQAEAIGEGNPEALEGQDRVRLIERVMEAVRHLRVILQARPDDADAQHDMAVLKSWLIALRDEWKRLDEAKPPPEPQEEQPESALEILAKLRDAQRAIADAIAAATESATEISPLAAREREEVAPKIVAFKEAFEREFDQAAAAVQDPAQQEQMTQARAQIVEVAESLKAGAESVATALEASDAANAAAGADQIALTADELWKALAPFQAVLARAHQEQKQIVEGIATASADDQSATRAITELMLQKALAQKAESDAGAAASAGAGAGAGQATEDPLALALAVAAKNGPLAIEKQNTATTFLEAGKWESAKPPAEEALALLEEILKELPQDPASQQSQSKEEQEQEEKEGEEQKEQDQAKQDEASKDEQESKSKEGESEEEAKPGELTQEEAQAMLQQIREREAERRQAEKQRRGMGRIGVEKDW